MTWHLKDRELEEKIIAIDPEFLKRLHINQEILFSPLPSTSPSLSLSQLREILKAAPKYEFELRTKKGILGKLVFDEFELEDIPEYNPHEWNNYPEVTPPEGVPMRVESKKFQNSKIVFTRECAIFRNGEWTHPEIGYPMVRKSCRFRPWED